MSDSIDKAIEIVDSWDDLLAADDTLGTTFRDVKLTDTKSVRLASLPALDLLAWLADNRDAEKVKTNGLVLITKCIINEKGERIGKLDEVVALQKKQPGTLKRLRAAAIEINDLQDLIPGYGKSPNDSGETTEQSTPSGASPTV